jgi:hypothetical protein
LRRLLTLALLAVVLFAGCGASRARTDEEVVRAWSSAVNADHNYDAADFFAAGAKVVQADQIVLHDHADAERWNASLPCAGRIDSVVERPDGALLVTFTLAERPHHACDGPGNEAAAIFRLRDGKITLFHQTSVPQDTTPFI